MGNADTKLKFRKAVIQLTTKTQPVEATDEAFWSQFWAEHTSNVQDVFALIPAAEIRALREESPSNLATLCYKCVERLVVAADGACRTQQEQNEILNCVRLLTRVLPYIFEDPDWRGFFWSTLPGQADSGESESPPLAQSLLIALSDLLFCPDFTVGSPKKQGPDEPEDMQHIDSCEYIWEAGVGFAQAPQHSAQHDSHRTEILKLVLTCFSQTMYLPPQAEAHVTPNPWIKLLTSTENRHALPLFTSLINVVCAYDPVGYGVPYNYLMFQDSREPLVEAAIQVLCVTLDPEPNRDREPSVTDAKDDTGGPENLFVNYLSRIHREEDMAFVLKGVTRLLNNPLLQTYLPGSTKKVQFNQELLVLFWKMCDINKKFMFYVLKSSDVLEVLVPILYHLNDARADQSRVGLMHIGVFILLLLSGERNFGVRLNKPYTVRVPMDIPVFTGTHADLLIVVFHKIITTGHQRLQALFDCLLTIIVNVSPYLKTLSMVAATKLLHLLEAFSTPWFLFASPSNHHLVFFLLEIFNNIIQYQFDGNCNLIYSVIRKREVFRQLAELPTDHSTIVKAVMSRKGKRLPSASAPANPMPIGVSWRLGIPLVPVSMSEAPVPASGVEAAGPTQAASGTVHTSLAATPGIEKMTERSTAHDEPPQSPQHTAVVPQSPDSEDRSTLKEMIDQAQAATSATGAPGDKDEKPAASQTADPAPLSRPDVEGAGAEGSKEATPGGEQAREEQGEHRASRRSSGASVTSQGASSVRSSVASGSVNWVPTTEWVQSWKSKLPLQTIMRMLQVLVPQVEKICIDKGLTDESEILKFLQHGTLVGLLPVPHPILIRKYQANAGTAMWFRTYMWGVIYLRNVDPPVWYDTDVKLFEIQRV